MDRIEVFTRHRPLLFSIAYRLTGSVMDAEDILQEAFLRWQNTTDDDVRSPKAYLSAIVTRLGIDHLRSAQVQREDYLGPWLPEPLVTDQPPDTAVLAESLSMAFLVLLESLSPVERAVFLLREVFDYEYEEIAKIVEKSEANCRQLVRRAKAHLADRRPRFNTSKEQQQQITFQFAQACLNGNLNGLLSLLAEDVVNYSDGGGKATAATKPVYSSDKVARFWMGLTRNAPPGFTAQFGTANGQPAILGYVNGKPYSVSILHIEAGRIQGIYNILNPEKLKRVPPAN
jgi:RNA polymerase sigma-70 factor (ECF subfamily)